MLLTLAVAISQSARESVHTSRISFQLCEGSFWPVLETARRHRYSRSGHAVIGFKRVESGLTMRQEAVAALLLVVVGTASCEKVPRPSRADAAALLRVGHGLNASTPESCPAGIPVSRTRQSTRASTAFAARPATTRTAPASWLSREPSPMTRPRFSRLGLPLARRDARARCPRRSRPRRAGVPASLGVIKN